MPTHTKPSADLSEDAKRLIGVFNDISGINRLNSLEKLKADPTSFNYGEPVSLEQLASRLDWDRARLLAAWRELMNRNTVNKALKVLTGDESIKAAIVFTAFYTDDERIEARSGTAGSELDDPTIRRILAQTLRAIADKLDG